MPSRMIIGFESNVILDRYKTIKIFQPMDRRFESNVILDRYKTLKAILKA